MAGLRYGQGPHFEYMPFYAGGFFSGDLKIGLQIYPTRLYTGIDPGALRQGRKSMSGWDEVATIKASHEESLLARPNVVGVGTGYKVRAGQIIKEPCVVALVRQKVPEAGLTPAALVPPEIGGIPTDVLEVGDLRALQARTDRWRPAPGGGEHGPL